MLVTGRYRGDGAFGQFCIVMPEQDAVVAITSGVGDMQAVLNLVWDHLLPAMKPSALAPDDEARQKLEHRLSSLSLRPQEGSSSNEKVASMSGKRYRFPENPEKFQAVILEDDGKGDEAALVVTNGGIDRRIAVGRNAWRKGRLALGVLPEQPVAASGAWTGDDTFTAKICFVETPFIFTIQLRFAGKQVFLDSRSNVSFGPTKQPQVVGTAE